MSDKKGRLLESVITPEVQLRYAYLTKVDAKYKIFSVQGILDPLNDPKHKDFVDKLKDKIKTLADDFLSTVDEKKQQFIKKQYKLEFPLKDELVDYKATGKLILKAKSNSEHPPTVFIVTRGKLEATTKIVWGGSIGEIKILLNPYVCDAQKTYGVSFLLHSVKVVKFAASKGVAGAASGFTADADTVEDTPVTGEESDNEYGEDEEDEEAGNF